MGRKGTRSATMEGHQMECGGRTPEDSKINLPPVLPAVAGSVEQVCVCVCAKKKECFFEDDYEAFP
jgi:hypothetical protein